LQAKKAPDLFEEILDLVGIGFGGNLLNQFSQPI
jgi:hypothetical protein